MTDTPRTASPSAHVGRVVRAPWLPYLVLLIAGAYFATSLIVDMQTKEGGDFTINWTATRAAQSGISLYDLPALRAFGMAQTDPVVQNNLMFTHRFNSFTNLPSTILIFWPFALLPYSVSMNLYRVTMIALFIAAIWLSGLALPPAYRRHGWFIGLLGFFLLRPVVTSVRQGQLDGWVALALAFCLWVASRHKWGLVGVGAAIATLLKISPGLLLLYLVLRGKWQAVAGAAITVLVAFLGVLLTGHASDLQVYVTQVLPDLSRGTLYLHNESLPAWIGRLLSPEVNLISFDTGLGPFIVAVPVLTTLGFVAVWFVSGRLAAVQPLALGVLVMVALIASSLTWNLYFTWGLVLLVQVSDGRAWAGLRLRGRVSVFALLAAGILLMSASGTVVDHVVVDHLTPGTLQGNLWLRLLTGLGCGGMLCWFAAGLVLLNSLREYLSVHLLSPDEVPQSHPSRLDLSVFPTSR